VLRDVSRSRVVDRDLGNPLSQSDLVDKLSRTGLSDPAELAEMARGWLHWGQLPDAWFCVLHGEILCRP
jgi:hypothetical protein